MTDETFDLNTEPADASAQSDLSQAAPDEASW